ncbi:MAG: YjgN family protein [Pseudomonadota bacterium]
MEEQIAAPTRELPLQFHATGAEYFRIWIVNLLLTIITLGIYSAWAKVRRLRYFYGSTSLDGTSFEYHGKPIPILKGRLIAVAAYAVLALGGRLSPYVAFLMLPLIFFGVPWIIVKARLFQMRMSSWRGLRFNFHGNYTGALGAYVGWMLLAMVTLMILWPWALWKQNRYLLGNGAYGTERFEFHATKGQFYKFCLIGLALLLAALCMAVLPIRMLYTAHPELLRPNPNALPVEAAMVSLKLAGAIYLFAGPLILLAVAWFHARLLDVSIGGLTLGPHRVFARLRTWPLFWIYLTNLLAMICTLGLFYPWAKVRMLRYQTANIGLIAHGSLDQFVADTQTQASAVGEGMHDVFDIDFGF